MSTPSAQIPRGELNQLPLRTSGVNQLACAWCGPAAIALFVIGFIAIARFIPPLPPSDTALMTAAIFRERSFEIRTGMLVIQVALGLFLPWGVAIAGRVSLIEKGRVRTFSYLQLGAVTAVTMQLVLMSVIWAVAAFRAEELEPTVIQMLNDVGWFLFLFCFVPMTIWVGSLAIPILQDRSPDPDYPRWVGYLSIWVAMLLLPGGALIYFTDGVFAWNGLFPFYMPFAAFFVWVGAVATYTLRAIRAEQTAGHG